MLTGETTQSGTGLYEPVGEDVLCSQNRRNVFLPLQHIVPKIHKLTKVGKTICQRTGAGGASWKWNDVTCDLCKAKRSMELTRGVK